MTAFQLELPPSTEPPIKGNNEMVVLDEMITTHAVNTIYRLNHSSRKDFEDARKLVMDPMLPVGGESDGIRAALTMPVSNGPYPTSNDRILRAYRVDQYTRAYRMNRATDFLLAELTGAPVVAVNLPSPDNNNPLRHGKLLENYGDRTSAMLPELAEKSEPRSKRVNDGPVQWHFMGDSIVTPAISAIALAAKSSDHLKVGTVSLLAPVTNQISSVDNLENEMQQQRVDEALEKATNPQKIEYVGKDANQYTYTQLNRALNVDLANGNNTNSVVDSVGVLNESFRKAMLANDILKTIFKLCELGVSTNISLFKNDSVTDREKAENIFRSVSNHENTHRPNVKVIRDYATGHATYMNPYVQAYAASQLGIR